MCGISGVVAIGDDSAPIREEELRPVNDAMTLRGPDDAGYFIEPHCGLGHRRLSIIDLAGGHQPMGTASGDVQVVLNGEIYNFRELRARLEARGHVFRTQSDTEVVVHGYVEWGDAVVDELDGMFAFAVWDRKARRLLLARDRFGKKPLVWFRAKGRFVFASTLSALLKHEHAPRELDESALERYLALEFVPAPEAIVRGMHKLEPGTTLTLDDKGALRERRFFSLEVRQADHPVRGEEAEEGIRARLLAATKKRLISDVPLGIFLSGGIDSSAVTWAASELGVGRIKTFSIGFADASFDESVYARKIAERFGTDHHEERLEAEDMLAIVPKLGEVLDEPMADPSIVPTYLLSRLARRQVTVALGGDGGDELFAGYPTYTAHWMMDHGLSHLMRGPLHALATRAAAWLPVSHRNMSFDFKLKQLISGAAFPEAYRNYVWLGAFRPDELARLRGHAVDEATLYRPVSDAYAEATGRSNLERVLYQDVRLYLAHEILMKVDRASMANSLEVRAPLLDTELARYVGTLALTDKKSATDGKVIFKRALKGRLPEEILYRKKKGFGMPVGAWLRGPLNSLAREHLLGSRGIAQAGWVQRSAVERLFDEHEGGRVDHRKRLWTLLVLELWRARHLA